MSHISPPCVVTSRPEQAAAAGPQAAACTGLDVTTLISKVCLSHFWMSVIATVWSHLRRTQQNIQQLTLAGEYFDTSEESKEIRVWDMFGHIVKTASLRMCICQQLLCLRSFTIAECYSKCVSTCPPAASMASSLILRSLSLLQQLWISLASLFLSTVYSVKKPIMRALTECPVPTEVRGLFGLIKQGNYAASINEHIQPCVDSL